LGFRRHIDEEYALDLQALGWKPCFAESFAPYAQQARSRRIARAPNTWLTAIRWFSAEMVPAGVADRGALPAVGDCCGRAPAGGGAGHHRGPAPNSSPRAAGLAEEQVLAANVDTAFLVSG
jgi:hypothetical protein